MKMEPESLLAPPAREAVTLRQRVWPLAEMIKRSQSAQIDIVWDV